MVEASRRRILAARLIAILTDLVQLGFMPLFAEGAASFLSDALDLLVSISMILLVGWHWAFLPTFVAKLIPMVDLAPTWTVAVFIATRQRHSVSVQPRDVAKDEEAITHVKRE